MLFRSIQIRRTPKPVVAMIAGYAIGGGHVLHVVCDLSVAADNARFGQTGPMVGSFDGGYGSGLLARTIGQKRSREVWYTCRQYGAEQAYDWGLVNAVVPLPDLEIETVRWAREMLELSPLALRMLKASHNAADDGLAGVQQLAGEQDPARPRGAHHLHQALRGAQRVHNAELRGSDPEARALPAVIKHEAPGHRADRLHKAYRQRDAQEHPQGPSNRLSGGAGRVPRHSEADRRVQCRCVRGRQHLQRQARQLRSSERLVARLPPPPAQQSKERALQKQDGPCSEHVAPEGTP